MYLLNGTFHRVSYFVTAWKCAIVFFLLLFSLETGRSTKCCTTLEGENLVLFFYFDRMYLDTVSEEEEEEGTINEAFFNRLISPCTSLPSDPTPISLTYPAPQTLLKSNTFLHHTYAQKACEDQAPYKTVSEP